jgi:CHASE3 domain sensor protein
MQVSQLWRREHGTGDEMEDARRALRETNARRDHRLRAIGRSISETISTTAALVIVLTALALVGKLIFLAWRWILS